VSIRDNPTTNSICLGVGSPPKKPGSAGRSDSPRGSRPRRNPCRTRATRSLYETGLLTFSLLACLVSLARAGCRKEAGPPALSRRADPNGVSRRVSRMPNLRLRSFADKVLKALESKDYPAAHQAVQDFTMSPWRNPTATASRDASLPARGTTLLQTAASDAG